MRPTFSLRKPNQAGVSLFVVLIGMLALSLAALAIIKSVDTSTLIAGNLGFKNATTAAADQSSERAITWLLNNNNGSTLYNDLPENFYYSTSIDNLDSTGKGTGTTRVAIDWDSTGCGTCTGSTCARCLTPSPEVTVNGYTTRYLITRMCKISGDPNNTASGCSTPFASNDQQVPYKGEIKYGAGALTSATGPYYRIVVHATGPRNSVSYTETYVHF